MEVLHSGSPDQAVSRPNLRSLSLQDLKDVLVKGVEDFAAMPTHALFLIAIYPVAGIVIAAVAFENDLIPILFPLASGFALLGPFAAIGLYEMSRRREQG